MHLICWCHYSISVYVSGIFASRQAALKRCVVLELLVVKLVSFPETRNIIARRLACIHQPIGTIFATAQLHFVPFKRPSTPHWQAKGTGMRDAVTRVKEMADSIGTIGRG